MALPRISIVVTSVLTSVAALPGCASHSAETRQHVQRLQERVAILQNERDRLDERVSALEAQQELVLQARPQPTAAHGRPPLKLVKLAPPDAPGAEPGVPPPHAANAEAPALAAESKAGSDLSDAAPTSADPANAEQANAGARVLISGTGNNLSATEVAGDSP